MSNVLLSLSSVLDTTYSNSVTVGMLDSVEQAIHSPSPDMDIYCAMARDICSTTELHDYLSVDLFMDDAQKIYISNQGLYEYSEYLDQDMLELLDEEKPYEIWLVGRPYLRYYGTSKEQQTLSYIRRLPIYHSVPNGYVVFHIPMENIHQLIRKEQDMFNGTLLIGLNGQTLYSNDDHFTCGNAFPSDEEISEYAKSLSGIEVLSNLNTSVNCRYILPNRVLYGHFFDAILGLLPAFLAFLVLLLGCAFGYSLLMIGPLDRILRQADLPNFHKDGDEYQQLKSTMSSLTDCIDLLTDELQRNLLPIQERYIIDLTTNYTDISSRIAHYEEIGISLPYNHFVVILADCSSVDGFFGLSNKEQIKLLIRDRLTSALTAFGIIYSANIAQERLLFLVNSNSDNIIQSIQKACTDIASELLDILPQIPSFSMGSYTSSDHAIPYYAYLQARSNMAFSHGSDNGELLVADAPAPILPSADTQTADTITGLLLDHDTDGLRSYLENLFRTALEDADSLENGRLFAISCLCITLPRMIDLELDILPDQASAILKKLSHAESNSACIELLLVYFTTAINGEKKLSAEAERHVSQAVSFIQTHYTENITVPQIATDVALSPIYLNKLFKLSTGRTISDYLNLYRTEKAKELLASTPLSLNEISYNLGYNDVRSLVRFFKKYNGITPGEYRQSLVREETSSGI